MPQNPQPANHLDPDQLNAFVENALPPHERATTLAHLADCADCRQIVFLVQQSIETEVPVPAPANSWHTWFTSAPLLGAATAALACTIVLALIVHLHHTEPADTNVAVLTPQPKPNQHAESVPTDKESPVPQLQQRPTPQPIQSNASAPPPKSPAPVHTGAVMGGMAAMPSIAPLPADSSRFLSGTATGSYGQQIHGALAPSGGPLKGNPTVITGVAPAAPANLGSASGAGMAAGVPQGYTLAKRSPTNGPLQNPQSQMAQYAQQMQQAQAVPPAPPAAPKQPVPASPNGRAVDSLASAAAETVTVSDSATLETTNAASFTLLPPQSQLRKTKQTSAAPLPSNLPTASTTAAANRTLAIDTAGALFLSTDSGHHWTSIHAQWPGRAVAVALANQPAPKAAAGYARAKEQRQVSPDSNASATIITGAAMAAAPPPPAVNAAPTLVIPPAFQLTTDNGTVWQSSDGQIWHRR